MLLFVNRQVVGDMSPVDVKILFLIPPDARMVGDDKLGYYLPRGNKYFCNEYGQ